MSDIRFSRFIPDASICLIFNKWVFVFFSLFFFFPKIYSLELNPSQTIYISSSLGDDRNDGNILSPKKTLSGLPEYQRNNRRILLKRDDIFYENISGFNSCIITSYGEGQAPLICGFRKLRSNAYWEKESENIWKIDLYQKDNFSGYSLPSDGSRKLCNNIGFIYDEVRNDLHGHLVSRKNLLRNKWDLYTSENNCSDQEFRFLYIFHENPKQELGMFCFPVYEVGITNLQNCYISHISVQGFSKHGINNLNNCTIENCAVDLIGGSIRLDCASEWDRHGNGVEFRIGDEYNSANGNLIKNCWISRVYGSGAAIQGENALVDAVSNKFQNNVFYYCRQAFETVLRGRNTNYVDCEFTENICYKMGENGFNTPEDWDANILSYETSFHRNQIEVHNNFFWGSNHIYMNSKFSALDLKYNVVFIYQGQYLNNFSGNYKPFYANGFLETNKYHETLKSKDYIYIINPKEKQNKSIQSYQTYLNVYFSQIDIRNLPDFQGLQNSLTMLRYIAGQREF